MNEMRLVEKSHLVRNRSHTRAYCLHHTDSAVYPDNTRKGMHTDPEPL